MNATIERYINPGMEELEKFLAELKSKKENEGKDTKIPKEYKGYISSLGASINMSGLVPTLAFYSSTESSAKEDRPAVLKWIQNILIKEAPYKDIANFEGLFKYAREEKSSAKKRKLEIDILNVSVALKLCIRTFELTK